MSKRGVYTLPKACFKILDSKEHTDRGMTNQNEEVPTRTAICFSLIFMFDSEKLVPFKVTVGFLYTAKALS